MARKKRSAHRRRKAALKRRNPIAKAVRAKRPQVKPARRRPPPETGEWDDGAGA
jgi:hypothetical protein